VRCMTMFTLSPIHHLVCDQEMVATMAFRPFRPHVLAPGIVPDPAPPHGAMVPVAPDSPLFQLCQALCRTRGSFCPDPMSVAGFELVRVDAVANSDGHIAAYEARQEVLKRLRTSGHEAFNPDTQDFSVPKLDVLLSLLGVMQERKPDADPRSPRTLYVFHGPRLANLASICENGIVALGETDAGYFGLGCNVTLNIEYAANNARGDYTYGALQDRVADGCVPVIMLAATVGLAFPVTPDEDYPESCFHGHSKWFGKPLKRGFDCHVACVSQRQRLEAVQRPDCEYMELVVGQESQLLPVAVLWLREN
jgi:hypothetical protein